MVCLRLRLVSRLATLGLCAAGADLVGFHIQQPPEIVAEREVPIGPDGKVEVEIDTAVAKLVHPDQDHQYTITAEVVDASRRTIVGQGNVLVARKPFRVYTWVDRGYYRVGDTIRAEFQTQTLDQKPVRGKGIVSLYQISYKDAKPEETLVRKWDQLDPDDQGHAELQIKRRRRDNTVWRIR